jgi:hypothetical protein
VNTAEWVAIHGRCCPFTGYAVRNGPYSIADQGLFGGGFSFPAETGAAMHNIPARHAIPRNPWCLNLVMPCILVFYVIASTRPLSPRLRDNVSLHLGDVLLVTLLNLGGLCIATVEVEPVAEPLRLARFDDEFACVLGQLAV